MPTVTLALRSQRKRPIPDEIHISIRGLTSGPVQSGDIEIRPGGEVVLDLVPDQYTIDIEPAGFVSSRAKLKVGFDPIVSVLTIESLVTKLPTFEELSDEQKRLVISLDSAKNGSDIWDSLPDNKAATFFQITHALTEVTAADGSPLSTIVDRVVRLGGSQLTAPDTTGTPRTVIGWRMHVVFVGGMLVDDLLLGAKFKRDTGVAHPTHKRFGFVNSFREKGANPRLQFVTNHEGAEQEVVSPALRRKGQRPFDDVPFRRPETSPGDVTVPLLVEATVLVLLAAATRTAVVATGLRRRHGQVPTTAVPGALRFTAPSHLFDPVAPRH